jgi:hypothetical protein
MKRSLAKEIAEKISNEEIREMFVNAKNTITEWSKVSIVNKGMSKGCAWNILASDFKVEQTYNLLAKINMVREFGEYLPPHLKLQNNKTNKITQTIVCQEPNFKNYD